MSSNSFSRKLIPPLTLLLLCFFTQIQAIPSHVPKNCSKPDCWTITTDYLVWYASEEVASIWADVITIGDNESSWDARGFNFKWGQGARLGASRALHCDNWDTSFYWTWFQTSNHKRIPYEENSRISPEFFAAFLSGNTPESMSGKWSLLLNMFDWELGRGCYVCKNFYVRPFFGLKGGWIHQTIKVRYNDLIIHNIPTNFSASEHLRNNFSGAGPLVGVNTRWSIGKFCSSCVSLIGDFSIATLFGSWACDDFYENTLSQTSSVTTKGSKLGALMFRGFFGVQCDIGTICRRTHLSAKLGYETQIWLNQLRIATFQLQRLHNDLTLQGLTLSAAFNF